tara:strand:- start:925 stop:1437 length:513 start_codon:yes stop_codon:yes gene_type:complete
MGSDSPMYLPLIGSIVENMNISNRAELLLQIEQMQKPDEKAQQSAAQSAKVAMDFQIAQTGMVSAQGKESSARAVKYMEEAKAIPKELEIEKIKATTSNLDVGVSDDKEFERRLKIVDMQLREKQIDGVLSQAANKQRAESNALAQIQGQSLPQQPPVQPQGMPQGVPQE